MNRPLAFGLIVFFIMLIAASAVWLAVRPQAPGITEAPTTPRRFPFGLFGTGQPSQPSAPATEGESATGGGGGAEQPKTALTLLASGPVAGFTAASGSVRYIERQTGHVFEVGPQGENPARLSGTTIPKILAVVWSPDPSRAILTYTENESVRVVSAVFQASTTRVTPMPLAASAAFAPLPATKLLLFTSDAAGGRLRTIEPDGVKQTEVLTTPFPDFLVSWINKNTVALLARPSGTTAGFLYSYALDTKRLSKIIGDALGLESLWSPDGGRIVFSSYDPATRLPQLSLLDAKTRAVQNLGITVMASKCVFSTRNTNTLYCGIDSGSPAGLYPDEWLRGALSTSDALWKINLVTFEKTQLGAARLFDVFDPRVSPDGHFLYFLDKKNNSLWSYKLSD